MSVAKSSEKIINQLQIRVEQNSREVMRKDGSQQKTAKKKYTSGYIREVPFRSIYHFSLKIDELLK